MASHEVTAGGACQPSWPLGNALGTQNRRSSVLGVREVRLRRSSLALGRLGHFFSGHRHCSPTIKSESRSLSQRPASGRWFSLGWWPLKKRRARPEAREAPASVLPVR